MRRNKVVITKPIQQLYGALGELEAPDSVGAALALVTGESGHGKSTGVSSAVGVFCAASVKARAIGKVGTLLTSICFELGIDAPRFNNDKLQNIIDALKQTKTPLFIDEADHLIRDYIALETLRDIHDEAGATVVLIGMNGIERKLSRYPQFMRRISQHIEFTALDLQDAELIARELCEVELTPDLIKLMHAQCEGNIGLMTNAIKCFEKMAGANGLAKLDAVTWAKRPMFLGVERKGRAVA